jgi:hypothetical protein
MGEQRATTESIVSNQADGVNLGASDHLPTTDNIACLYNLFLAASLGLFERGKD